MRAWIALATAAVMSVGLHQRLEAQHEAWSRDAASGTLTHRLTGVRFPEQCGGMTRREVLTIDGKGEHISVGYEREDGQLWATVYLYPNDFGDTPDPREHFKASMSAVTESYPAARRENAIERPLPLGGRERPGFVAFFRYRDRSTQVGSLLFLVPVGKRFVKVRTTRMIEAGDEQLGEALGAGLDLLALLDFSDEGA